MSLNDTPLANRIHIGIFGKRNAGKSSLINALTGQETALVSPVAGTTTDPVSKTMELLPLGPVVLIDTPGLDDTGSLGSQRVRRSHEILETIDMALLVVDANMGIGGMEQAFSEKLRTLNIPYITVYNKMDELTWDQPDGLMHRPASEQKSKNTAHGSEIFVGEISVSAKTGYQIHDLRQQIAHMPFNTAPAHPLAADLLKPCDIVLLVAPIDGSAPKGRLILPQQQVIREILDAGAQAFVTKEDGLINALNSLAAPPRLVVTDSQVFQQVSRDTPQNIPLTSFSILFARHKGMLTPSVHALAALDGLSDGSRVLISEGCSHHRQCEDIGTVKIPRWLGTYTGKELQFEFTSGNAFPEDLTTYDLIVHCGGCMITQRAMQRRFLIASGQQVPMTNYGILIAHMNGILERSIAPFGSAETKRVETKMAETMETVFHGELPR